MALILPGIPREAGTASEHARTLRERGRGEGAAAAANDFPVHQCLQVGISSLSLFCLGCQDAQGCSLCSVAATTLCLDLC